MPIFLVIFGCVTFFFFYVMTFFWGAKLAGVKNVNFFRSLIIAILTAIILVPVHYVLSFIPLLVIVAMLLLFIVPMLIVKEVYKINIGQAFWAAFGAILMTTAAEVSIKIIMK